MKIRGDALRDVLQLLRLSANGCLRRRFAVASLLVVAGAACAALAPLALKSVVDALAVTRADTGERGRAVAVAVIAYLVVLGTGRVLSELRPLVVGAAEQQLYATLTQRVFSQLLSLPMAFHLRRSSAGMAHIVQQAISGCQVVMLHLTSSLVSSAVEIGTVVIVLARLGQPALVATFTVAGAAHLVIHWRQVSALSDRSRGVAAASQATSAAIGDGLLNIEAIKCFNVETTAHRSVAEATERLRTHWLRLHRTRAGTGLIVSTLLLANLAVSLAIATQGVMQGTLSIGAFVLTTIYMLQMVRPIESLGVAARDVSHALELIRPALEIMQTPSEVQSRPAAHGAAAPGGAAPTLSLQQVSFGYEHRPAVLSGLDLHVPAGARIGLVGPSGSGKSSLGRLLLRLHAPQSGSILLDGVSIMDIDLHALRRSISLVPQDIALFRGSLAFNIGIGRPDATLAEVQAAARVACLHEFVQSLPEGYDTTVGERGLTLSGGERQRVAIARAVLKRPGLYIFDEATSMLDGSTEAAVLRNLQVATAGCTTITIAHRLSTVVQSDEIIVMESGRVVQRGCHLALLRQGGLYVRLWQRDNGDGRDTKEDGTCRPVTPLAGQDSAASLHRHA